MQIREWLGFEMDCIHYHSEFRRRKSPTRVVRFSYSGGVLIIRDLARIAGTLISVALPVGPSPLKPDQNGKTFFPSSTRTQFWYCNIDCFNGYSIRPPLATHIVLFSRDGTVVNDMWEPEDKLFIMCCFLTLLNWNTKELKSLLIISAQTELLLSDRKLQNSSPGSGYEHFYLCLSSIVLEVQWIPRPLNEKADLLSSLCWQRWLVHQFFCISSSYGRQMKPLNNWSVCVP